MDKVELNKLSNEAIGVAIEIHKEPGPGLVEKFIREFYIRS